MSCYGFKAFFLDVLARMRPHRFGPFSTISSLEIVSALDKPEKFRA